MTHNVGPHFCWGCAVWSQASYHEQPLQAAWEVQTKVVGWAAKVAGTQAPLPVTYAAVFCIGSVSKQPRHVHVNFQPMEYRREQERTTHQPECVMQLGRAWKALLFPRVVQARSSILTSFPMCRCGCPMARG